MPVSGMGVASVLHKTVPCFADSEDVHLKTYIPQIDEKNYSFFYRKYKES